MGRRAFGGSLRVSAVVLVTAMSLAACQGAGGPTGSGGEGSANPDTLVITVNDQPTTLDPAQVDGGEVGNSVMHNVYERLLEIPTEGGSPTPGLATKVPNQNNGLISEDGLTYTFPIRKDVKFHDDTDLTAEDVKFSWDRIVEMDLPEGQSELFGNVAETRVVDDYTFEVKLRELDGSFLLRTVMNMAASIVSQDAVEANGGVESGQPNEFMSQNMVGTGPYTFETWERGDRMTFDVFEDYWGEPANLPVRWELIVDTPSTGLQAREYDIVDISATDVPTIDPIEHAVVEPDILGLQVLQIGFNMNIDPEAVPSQDDVPPDFFADPRVRQAFNYAFDYEGYIEGILGGLGDRGSFVLPQGMVGYDPDAPIYPHDPERAEELFREAGWWDRGFTVSIATDQTHEGFTGAALTLKDSIEALNPKFTINVLSVPEARFDEMIATQPLPMSMWSYTSTQYNNPAAYFFDSATSDGRYGRINGFEHGYSDPERIDSMIAEAQRTLDDDERLAIYSELQEVLYEEAMWVMPAQEAQPAAYGEWVKNYVINPMWPRPAQRWALYDK
jgi:peptide/nickel transport system substrate-binding protein